MRWLGTPARWALTGVLVALVSACALGQRPTIEPEGSGVVLLGDSIMFESADELAGELPGGLLDAVPGRTMVTPALSDAGLPRVPLLAEAEPSKWVVELGTNDALFESGRPTAQLVADVDQLLGAIDATSEGSNVCVWWVLPTLAPPVSPSAIDRARLVADTVRASLDGRPCGGVIDWPGVVAADPSRLDTDGIHPTATGEQAFAEMVAGAVGPQG